MRKVPNLLFSDVPVAAAIVVFLNFLLAVIVRFPQTTQNLVISRSWFVGDGKEMYNDL